MIRAVLVDDEEPARDRLQALLRELGTVRVVGVAEDAEEALEKITEARPNLVFLDIQMPGRSGLELVASLPPPRPRIIFCTAFDQYAIDAFEHDAVDYLLKPLNRQRLARAVDRVRQSMDEREELRREVVVASQAQARLLPQALPASNLIVTGVCRPARGVGGDYYDFLPSADGRLGLVVGDVSGKGLYAGLLMAGLQGRLQTLVRQYGDDLAALMSELNRLIYASTDGDKYATLFYGVFDDATRTLHYVNAGHNPPLIVRSDHSVERLGATGTAIGLMPDAPFAQASADVDLGDTLVLFTDGVTEAMNVAAEEFGDERLVQLATDHPHLEPSELETLILTEVDAFAGERPQHDDMTLVIARVGDRDSRDGSAHGARTPR